MISFHTAFNNDDNPDFAFAQQVVAFGRPGDLLFASAPLKFRQRGTRCKYGEGYELGSD